MTDSRPPHPPYRSGREPQAPRYTGRGIKIGTVLALMGTTAMVGFLAYPMIFAKGAGQVETSAATEFQASEETTSTAWARVAPTRPTQDTVASLDTGLDTSDSSFDFGPIRAEIDQDRRAIEARNAALNAKVEALQGELNAMAEGPSDELVKTLARLQEESTAQIAALGDAFDNRFRAAEAAAAERQAVERREWEELNGRLQAEIEALKVAQIQGSNQEAERLRLTIDQQRQQHQAEMERLEAERQAEFERRRRTLLEFRNEEQAKLMEARQRSNSVVFDAGGGAEALGGPLGGSSAGNGGAGGGVGGVQGVSTASLGGGVAQAGLPPGGDRLGREFLAATAAAAPVTQASLIANPSNTILQGTVIGATLDVAVDSSLPGSLSATVTEPVASFDGTQTLIPAGSKLFGQYSSDVSIGQGRVLVAWTRLVTPEGQSVQMSAFGGDAQGRSGISGRVNSRFGLRFGGAALVSVIGAAPAIAADQIGDDIMRATGQEVARDLRDASESVIAEYATLPPILTLEPGATVTIIVDRDLELF